MSSDGRGRSHHEQVRIFLRPVGSGLPLGFLSFAIGMLLLACFGIGWIPVSEQHDVGLSLVAYVFPLELVATVFAFLARDTLGATTLGLFTTSWLTYGLFDLLGRPGQKVVTIGVYSFGFAATIAILALLATLGKPFFTLLLTLAAVRAVLSGIYEAGGGHGLLEVSGGVALALTVLAIYGGAALGLEDAHQRELLPLFRRGGAQEAFHGYEAQLERLEAEPGVRQQL